MTKRTTEIIKRLALLKRSSAADLAEDTEFLTEIGRMMLPSILGVAAFIREKGLEEVLPN